MTDIQAIMEKAAYIRAVEVEIARRYPEGKMRCPIHLSIGQELSAAAVCHFLRPGDLVFSTHRCHAHYLAKGGDLKRMLAELYGKQEGCCHGRGGSMHLHDIEAGVMLGSPIVGSALPLALGAAWSLRGREEDNIVVAFMGDAAVEQGIFHECLLIAERHAFCVLFAIEENGLSVESGNQDRRVWDSLSTSLETDAVDFRNGLRDLRDAKDMIETMREGRWPGSLTLRVDRHAEHCGPAYTIPEHDPLRAYMETDLHTAVDFPAVVRIFDEVEALSDATPYEVKA